MRDRAHGHRGEEPAQGRRVDRRGVRFDPQWRAVALERAHPRVRAGQRPQPRAKRDRKLLAKKKEIAGWYAQVREKGITIVPLSLYFVGSRVKLRMALCQGKKLYDKREDKKEKDDKREMQRAMMRRR